MGDGNQSRGKLERLEKEREKLNISLKQLEREIRKAKMMSKSKMKKQILEEMLEMHDGCVSDVASGLGLSRPYVSSCIKKLGIVADKFRSNAIRHNDGAKKPTTRELVRLLKLHKGNVMAVCSDIGYSRNHVYRWIREADLVPNEFREKPIRWAT